MTSLFQKSDKRVVIFPLKLPQSVPGTVSIVYKVTGCNDIPAIMIELAKIKIKSQKNTAKISLYV